jgi:hypothetical protein
MKEFVAELKAEHVTVIEELMEDLLTQEEMREWVAYAHERELSSIGSRHMAASILCTLVTEKQLITNPLLIGYAAERVAINAHEYHWRDMLVSGMIAEAQLAVSTLSEQNAQMIVSLTAYWGAYGDWPSTPQANGSETEGLDPIFEPLSPYVFGAAIASLVSSEWAEEIATNLIQDKYET